MSLSSTLRITNARAHDAIWRFVWRFSFMMSARKTQRRRGHVSRRCQLQIPTTWALPNGNRTARRREVSQVPQTGLPCKKDWLLLHVWWRYRWLRFCWQSEINRTLSPKYFPPLDYVHVYSQRPQSAQVNRCTVIERPPERLFSRSTRGHYRTYYWIE